VWNSKFHHNATSKRKRAPRIAAGALSSSHVFIRNGYGFAAASFAGMGQARRPAVPVAALVSASQIQS